MRVALISELLRQWPLLPRDKLQLRYHVPEVRIVILFFIHVVNITPSKILRVHM